MTTTTGSTSRSQSSREALIEAGERLFAAGNIDGVSLREIGRAAGQRNATALQYHFGSRDGLIAAIVDKHSEEVAARRHALLDECRDEPTLRALCNAFVKPLASKLVTEDGRLFLQIAGHVINRTVTRVSPEQPAARLMTDAQGSIPRWGEMTVALMPPDTSGSPFHQRFAGLRFAYVELARRAQFAERRDDDMFVSHIVDLMTALLSTPLSDETRRRMDAGRSGSRPD